MLENASFVHVFGCMCMLELTITGWWIIVAYLSIPNWFELQLVSQLASYLFSYFYCDPYFLFQIQNFFLYLVYNRFYESRKLKIECVNYARFRKSGHITMYLMMAALCVLQHISQNKPASNVRRYI